RGGVADTDTAPEQYRHFEAAAAHVLHLGNLIDQLTECIVDEIDEHEIDDGPRPRHARTTGKTHKSALANRCIAEPPGAVLREQAYCSAEVSAARANALAKHEDAWVEAHLVIEGLECSGRKRDFPAACRRLT